MAVKISVASGKGGTGKTSIAIHLFQSIAENWTKKVCLMDCDVEEPNDLVFFPDAVKLYSHEVTRKVPFIETEKCTFCRACVDYCEFNAIVVIPPAEFASINADLCHSCGACLKACKFDAIQEVERKIGEISSFKTWPGSELVQGELVIGSSMQTPVIRDLKKTGLNDTEVILADAPPGTSCPVVASISDSDYVILVAEPTPFGLNDLKLSLDILAELNKEFGVIINKYGSGDDQMEAFLEEENVEILGRIPFSREYAGAYANGTILENIPPERKEFFYELVEKLKEKLS